MKGDFSKKTFNAKKHYAKLPMQQGRVLLDSDWNEQADITGYRIETETIDVIGQSGAPKYQPGFEIITVDNGGNPVSPGTGIKISKGRFYVDGILCENDADLLFGAQPDNDFTPLPALPADTGNYIFYLDVWQRHITSLEDPDIREVALGGPDTTTRIKTLWQVKCKKVPGAFNCTIDIPADVLNKATGTMNARSETVTGTADPCGLITSGGYKGLANQLYRVEIHKAGLNRASSTFKWSRDNGSVVVKWESFDPAYPNNLVVKSTGRDELLSFRSGNWVELIDDSADLLNKPGVLVQLSKVEGDVLTINPATIKDPNNPAATTVTRSNKNPRIRRWDSAGELGMNGADGIWLPLEDGVEVTFMDGVFRTGDYWLIPARTAKADIEWPFITPQFPLGIQHHFAKLAVVNLNVPVGGPSSWIRTSDCRNIFPPITELTSLYYVGGDGQEAMPNGTLPQSLQVGVANGQWAVEGASVKFEIVTPGAGTLNPAGGIVNTLADGIATCKLILGAIPPNVNNSIQVRASLLDSAGNISPKHLPVIFNASFNVAENISYNSKCNNWTGPAPATVAAAIDALCERKSGSRGCSYTIDPAGKGDFKTLPEAIEKLNGREKQVSLCFMPGEHELSKEILMIKDRMGFNILEIKGFAATISMKAKRLELVADKLILMGFSLQVIPESPNQDNTQILLAAAEINMDYCSWNRPGNSDLPFITLVREGLVYLKNNKVLAALGLVLANGIQGVIENNIITYLLLQNDTSTVFKPAPLFWLTTDLKNLLRVNILQRLREEIRFTDWSLTIRGNRLGIVVTDTNRTKPQDLYQDMFVSENIFQLPGNSFGSRFLSIIGNQFLAVPDAIQRLAPVQAFIIGYNIMVTGNSATPGMAVTGAPLISYIDAIVLGAIKGDGVGPAQLLNLMNVVV